MVESVANLWTARSVTVTAAVELKRHFSVSYLTSDHFYVKKYVLLSKQIFSSFKVAFVAFVKMVFVETCF